MINKTQIAAAIRSVTVEKVLAESPAGRGGGSLLLVVRRNAAGVTCTWFAKWKRGGAVTKSRLGEHPAMTRDEALEAFKRESNPVASGAAKAERPTVTRLFEAYIQSMKDKGRSSWPEVERALLTGKFNAASDLGRDRAAGAITSGEIAGHLAKTYKRGSKVSADRSRSYLCAAFNWGIKAANDYTTGQREDWGLKTNPAAAVGKDAAAKGTRERALAAEEIKLVWDGIAGDGFDPHTTAAARMLLCCGQRARETLRIEGRDLDLDAGLWNMPAAKTKGGERDHILPLPRQAVEILRTLVAWHGDGWLFPSCEGAKLPHISDGGLSRALRRLQLDKGMKHFQMRDMRRTWKSRAKDAGILKTTRDLMQQHAQNDTSSVHYDRADYLPEMTAAAKAWEVWLDATLADKSDERQPVALAA